mgnify:CR=1 FL=1
MRNPMLFPPAHHGAAFWRFQWPLRTLIASMTVLVFAALDLGQFCFDRVAIIHNGEWWRLITSHMVHSNTSHLFWDVMTFAAVSAYLERKQPGLVVPAWLLGMVSVNLLLLSPLSDLSYYCGLSGILFTPLTLAVIIYQRETRGLTGWLPMLVCSTKLVWELVQTQTLLVNTDWQAYPESHAAGVIGGLLIFLYIRLVFAAKESPHT